MNKILSVFFIVVFFSTFFLPAMAEQYTITTLSTPALPPTHIMKVGDQVELIHLSVSGYTTTECEGGVCTEIRETPDSLEIKGVGLVKKAVPGEKYYSKGWEIRTHQILYEGRVAGEVKVSYIGRDWKGNERFIEVIYASNKSLSCSFETTILPDGNLLSQVGNCNGEIFSITPYTGGGGIQI